MHTFVCRGDGGVCVCVCACVRACVRACVHTLMHACVCDEYACICLLQPIIVLVMDALMQALNTACVCFSLS